MSELVHMMAPRTSVLTVYRCTIENRTAPDKELAACLSTADDPPGCSTEYAAVERQRREERAAELLVRRRRWLRMDVREKSTRQDGS